MKKLLLLFVLIASLAKSQCNQTSFSPLTICYPNQTISIPQGNSTDFIYLCGTNSVVWDTMNPPSIKYRGVFLNTGSVYNYKSALSNNQITIYAKSGTTVNILAGTNLAFSFSYTKESGAVLNNMTTGTISASTCSVIIGPSINCSVTSVGNFSQNESSTNVWPNPAHDKFFISSDGGKDKTVSIINMLGEVVYSQKGIKEQGQEISLDTFHSGIYYVIIRSGAITETKKIIVLR